MNATLTSTLRVYDEKDGTTPLVDTAVTLPIGVEAYAAFALRAWLTRNSAVSNRTRRFARWSAMMAAKNPAISPDISSITMIVGNSAMPDSSPGRAVD